MSNPALQSDLRSRMRPYRILAEHKRSKSEIPDNAAILTTMAQVKRALIVGGGIGGLSAAASLQMVGIDAHVFEQSPELREAGAGVGLWSNSMTSLDQLGAGDAVRRTCLPIRTIAAGNPQGRTLSSTNLDNLGPEFASAACYVLLRPILLAALAERVSRASIHTSSRAVRIEVTPDRVRLHLEGGQVEEGDLLVAADGLHSIVRSSVVGQDEIRYSGQTCFRGVAQYRAADPSVICEVQGAGQRGAVCPVNRETVYWWVALNAPPGQIFSQEERKAFLLERYKGWPFGLEKAIAATPVGAILHNDLVDRPPARNYTKGLAVLIGDAAHPTTPNLGQGANMAIDDGIVLARCLRDLPSVSAALAQYEYQRLRRTREIVDRSWNFGRMCLWKSATAVALREFTARIIPDFMMRRVLRWQILGVGPL
jgi:2-polyprenyl-6-methoxyphenol hydroxylase-like FAD-dependent oxidoreductase